MKKSILLALPLSFGGFVHADDGNNVYNFNGGGSCQKFITETSSEEVFLNNLANLVAISYIRGYISAFNTIFYNEKKIPSLLGKGLQGKYIIEYTKNYCLSNPNSDISDVAKSLLMDLTK